MWKLARVQVTGVRRAVEVEFDVNAPLVILTGPAGAGKTSTLVGLGWGLAGEARTDRGKLNQDQIRNYAFNGIAELALFDGTGQTLEIMRTLTPSAHKLYIDGAEFSVGRGGEELERRLGVSPDQLSYLTSAARLVDLSGLEQASLLCGLMGLEIDLAWLHEQVGADLMGALPKAAQTRGGWPMLEDTLAMAEKDRLRLGREAKAAQADADGQAAVVQEALKAARVPDAQMLENRRQIGEQQIAELRKRLQGFRTALQRQCDYDAALQDARSKLVRAEALVVDMRKQINNANAIRDERAQQREAVQQMLSAEWAQHAEAEAAANEASAAFNVAVARCHDWPEVDDLQGGECPTCKRALTGDDLKTITDEREKREAEAESLKREVQAARAKVQMHTDTIAQMEHELANLPEIAADADLQAKLQGAVQMSDAASNEIDKLDAMGRPSAPTPQEVDAAEAKAQELAGTMAEIDRAAIAGQDLESLQKKARTAAARYAQANKLVDRLREIVKEVAGQAIDPVIARCNDMLAPRLTLAYADEEGLVATYGEVQMPVAELSTGERLEVGVALQASIAVALGVGVCLVDDASVWDPETADAMYHHMALQATENDLTWIVATAQKPVLWTDGNMDIVEIDGGYSKE